MLDSRYRRARAAEGAGQWRRAASLWAEAGEPMLAAEALLHLAERAGSLEERLEAWQDALKWFPPEDAERRDEVERSMATAVLEDGRLRGAASAEEKRRLADAAARLERLDRPGDAAEAFEILGRTDDQARCLEAAGDIERLEALLDRTSSQDARQTRLRSLMGEYEMALRYGARLEARDALREAVRVAPEERSFAELLRRLEARMPPPSRVQLVLDGHRVTFVGRLPVVLGRGDVDVPIRGTSVSRRHAEIALEGETLVIRDLDSRNGTLVRGVPIRGSIELAGETEIGLGDDVTLKVQLHEGAVVIDVEGGFDRGERIVVGVAALRVPELAASLSFQDGWPVLAADAGVALSLEGQTCVLPVHLLSEDKLLVGGRTVEVTG